MSRKNKKKVFEEVYKRKFPSWDYGYFLKLQYEHLERMLDFFEGPTTHIMGAKEIASEIKEAMVILKRVVEDEYCLYHSWVKAHKLRTEDMEKYNKIIVEKLWVLSPILMLNLYEFLDSL